MTSDLEVAEASDSGRRCAIHSLQLRNIESSLRNIEKMLMGNGEPSKGFIVRLDRVEQKQVWVWTALTAGMAAIVRAFWEQISGGRG